MCQRTDTPLRAFAVITWYSNVMRSKPRLSAVLLAITVAGCHPRTPSPGPVEDNWEVISIRVVNRNRIDVQLFIAHNGRRDRLGLATASATTDFALPLRTLGAGREYRLIGEPVGLRIGITTETLHAQPGDEVTWSLEDSFARSTVVVH